MMRHYSRGIPSGNGSYREVDGKDKGLALDTSRVIYIF